MIQNKILFIIIPFFLLIIIINNLYKNLSIKNLMTTLLYIIIATTIVSLISLIGAVFFLKQEKKIKEYMILLVAFAAGSLIGASFFHLIPESFEEFTGEFHTVSMFILIGILTFYLIEKFIHWHHHHSTNCHKHSLSTLSLVGDGFHNFIDGVIIAGAFIINIHIGIATTIAIALHEIPQELGDLAILLHSGIKKSKALLLNFLSAITAILGGIIAYFFLNSFEHLIPLFTAFAAGGFIYISLADIIPELNKREHKFSQKLISIIFLVGIILSFLLTLFNGHAH